MYTIMSVDSVKRQGRKSSKRLISLSHAKPRLFRAGSLRGKLLRLRRLISVRDGLSTFRRRVVARRTLPAQDQGFEFAALGLLHVHVFAVDSDLNLVTHDEVGWLVAA